MEVLTKKTCIDINRDIHDLSEKVKYSINENNITVNGDNETIGVIVADPTKVIVEPDREQHMAADEVINEYEDTIDDMIRDDDFLNVSSYKYSVKLDNIEPLKQSDDFVESSVFEGEDDINSEVLENTTMDGEVYLFVNEGALAAKSYNSFEHAESLIISLFDDYEDVSVERESFYSVNIEDYDV
jgi:hypothetical protein